MGEDWFARQNIDLPLNEHPSVDIGNWMASADSRRRDLALDTLPEDNSMWLAGRRRRPEPLLQWFEKANLDHQERNATYWTSEYPSHSVQESPPIPMSNWTNNHLFGTNKNIDTFNSETTLLAGMGSVNTANFMPQNIASNVHAIPPNSYDHHRQEWCERDMPCSVYGQSRHTAYPEDWQDEHILGTLKTSHPAGWEANPLLPLVQVPSFPPLPHPALPWSAQHGAAEHNTGIMENVNYPCPTVETAVCHTLLKPQQDCTINLEPTSSANTVSARNLSGNAHHYFLDFLMKNPSLLSSVTTASNSLDGMTAIQMAFEEDCRRRGFTPPLAEIKKFFQQFKPTIGSAVGRQERDTKKTQKTKVYCPFQFCGNPFTRLSGLKNHISAHFRLTPRECRHCGRSFSDSSFKRHEDSCSSKDP